MKVSRPFICISLFLLFIGCVKKEAAIVQPETPQIPDTIKPLSYFPAYPGSWWTYWRKDEFGINVYTDSTSKTYIQHKYCLQSNVGGSGGCGKMSSATYVPFYKNQWSYSYSPIYGYCDTRFTEWRPYLAGFVQTGLHCFLSEVTGSCSLAQDPIIVDSRYSGTMSSQEFITNISKKVNQNSDSVIIATGRFINLAGVINHGMLNQITYREYTKNIGLNRYWVYDTVKHDTIKSIRLLNYFINH